MLLEAAFPSQPSFLEEQPTQHVGPHLTLCLSSSLCHLASVPTTPSDRLLSACPGRHQQGTGLCLYLHSHHAIRHCGPLAWENLS